MKKFITTAVVGLLVFSMAGCSSSSADTASDSSEATTEASADSDESAAAPKTANEGKLVWATNAEFEPYEYHSSTGEVIGIDAEIAQALGDHMGLEVSCEDMNFDSIIPAVTSGKADLGIAGMTVTDDRLVNVNFSTPYINAGQVIIVKSDSAIAGVADLASKKIGVQLGTTGDTYVSDPANVEGATVERYNKGFEAVQALTQGKVDAVVIDNEPAKSFVAANTDLKIIDEPITEEEYAIAVNKDNEELLNAVNDTLAEMEESGELSEIINKYLGDDAQSEDETAAEAKTAEPELVEETEAEETTAA